MKWKIKNVSKPPIRQAIKSKSFRISNPIVSLQLLAGYVQKSPPLSPEIDAEEGTMEPAAAAMFKAWSPKGFFKCGSARAWPWLDDRYPHECRKAPFFIGKISSWNHPIWVFCPNFQTNPWVFLGAQMGCRGVHFLWIFWERTSSVNTPGWPQIR